MGKSLSGRKIGLEVRVHFPVRYKYPCLVHGDMKSEVTKLCDLGPDGGVCSVQCTRKGSYLSIGSNPGEVQ
ncbi:hypothetical protein MKX01_021375, partial [Papaver californicum]